MFVLVVNVCTPNWRQNTHFLLWHVKHYYKLFRLCPHIAFNDVSIFFINICTKCLSYCLSKLKNTLSFKVRFPLLQMIKNKDGILYWKFKQPCGRMWLSYIFTIPEKLSSAFCSCPRESHLLSCALSSTLFVFSQITFTMACNGVFPQAAD